MRSPIWDEGKAKYYRMLPEPWNKMYMKWIMLVSTLLCTCVSYVENCIYPFRLIARVYTSSRISSSRLLS